MYPYELAEYLRRRNRYIGRRKFYEFIAMSYKEAVKRGLVKHKDTDCER